MELSIPVNKVNTQNIYFAEKRKNIIVDGDFVKLLYSTDAFEMNGLYIFVELEAASAASQQWIQITLNRPLTTQPQKRSIAFNPYSLENETIVNRLCQIEQDIVNRYIASYCHHKTASYILKTQLMGSTIKYHSENIIFHRDETRVNKPGASAVKEKCVLKISGIWETATNVGITMKFILLR